MKPITLDADAFWLASCEHYAKPGVMHDCLQAQDEYGLNVNLMLCLAWCGKLGVTLPHSTISVLLKAITKSEEKLVDLRRQRRAAKTDDKDRYQQLKTIELKAERAQQVELVSALNDLLSRTSDERSVEPLDCLIKHYKLSPPSALLQLLQRVFEYDE